MEERIQAVLDDYRPTLYMDGGDVHLLEVDEEGIAHVKMLGACIDCPISLLTMKLGIQRLLKENFSEIRGVNAITDLDISALYNRRVDAS
ncbi:MAG: NifU family protein [Caldilineaceae bacterium]|nr:NifU family protein [Caldilineaceae bacterium]